MAELERRAISARIKQARKEAGLTQPELAELLSVIPRSVQNYESDRVPWGLINDIARITGKSAEWLLHGREPAPSESAESSRQLLAGMARRLELVERKLDELTSMMRAQSASPTTEPGEGLPELPPFPDDDEDEQHDVQAG